MSPREIEEPTTNEYGDEVHPAYAMASVSRVHSTGTTLFDSEIIHSEVVVLRISHASRKRRLSSDWVHGDSKIITEIQMSMAQWASLVSSFNTTGVPVTLTFSQEGGRIPGFPHEPRLALSIKETNEAAHRAFDEIMEAFREYEAKPTKGNRHTLLARIQNAVPNVDFAARQLSKHSEDIVQKARADIEAMVTQHAERLGLTEAQRPTLELGGSDT